MEEFELEPGETITLSVRKHWIVLVGQVVSFAILGLLPLLLPYTLSYIQVANPALATSISRQLVNSGPWMQLFYAFWLLFIWMAAFSAFTRYYLTMWIITSTRIVEIHQYGFFSRRVSSFLLNRVQDVTTSVDGFLATVFGYGALDVETAGKDEKFGMYGIANHEGIRDLYHARSSAALHADGQLPQSGV